MKRAPVRATNLCGLGLGLWLSIIIDHGEIAVGSYFAGLLGHLQSVGFFISYLALPIFHSFLLILSNSYHITFLKTV